MTSKVDAEYLLGGEFTPAGGKAARIKDQKLIDCLVKKYKLSKTQCRMLHDETTGKHYDCEVIEDIAKMISGKG
jgi:hypothetical protein